MVARRRSPRHLATFMVVAVLYVPALKQLHLVAATPSDTDSYTSPQFTAPPTDLVVANGETATLQCGVAGQPPPSVTWFREGGGEVTSGGRFTVGSTTGELTISSVELSDEGEYYCVAGNAVGSVRSLSASLQLAVFNTEGLPEVGESLENLIVSNRQRMVLDCTVPTSLPPASIEWELNQALLDELDFSSGRVGITLSGKLVISSVDTTADSGRFYCYATNDVIDNSRTYTTGYLLIAGGAPQPLLLPTEFVTTPTSQTVVAGDSAQFDCFTTGSPVAEISWKKDGSPLSPSSSNHISFSQAQRVLTISPVAPEDAGSYICVAEVSSTSNTVESPAASLTVVVPPTMESSFSSLAADVTEEVILSCEVVASDDGSNIQWVWRVNSSEVVTSGNVLYDRTGLVSRLQIISVMEDSRGVYQCVASLVVAGGNQRQAAANERLSVILTPPTILTEPASDLLVFVGVAVSLPCTASGFPPPVFSWARAENTPVNLQDDRISLPAEGSGNGTLTISDTQVADSSPYQCTAVNSAGSASSTTVQLRVIVRSTIRRRPEDLAAGSPDGVFTAEHGARVTIPCDISRPQDGTTVVYQWYRDGQPVVTLTGTGTLVLEGVDEEDRGRYQCVVEIRASGVEGQPLEELIGDVTVGVGDQPTNPWPPTNPSITMVTSDTLTLSWTPPTFSGNLPLTAYVVEVQLLGNLLCPQMEPEWEVHQTVEETDAEHATVHGLIPFQEYKVRIRARNSANYQSDPSPVQRSVWTQPGSPLAPPSNVEVSPGNQLLLVTWEPPSDCLMYGGPLTDYIVSYRISSESTFVERRVGSNKTSLMLASLKSQTSYTVEVSAHTAEGAGPMSEPVEATTYGCSTPPLPTDLKATPFNSTTSRISWATPTDPNDLYIITWCHGDKETRNKVERGKTNSTLVTDLEGGRECVVTVQVNNQCGTGQPANITVAPVVTGAVSGEPVWETMWFIAVVAVVTTLLVSGIPTVIIFIICFHSRRQEGKIYFPSRRSGSSLSGASTAFTEFHQKHGGIARASGIMVHSDPPPQRRSTDYADLGSYNSHLSSSPPSTCSYQRQTTTETNGGPPSLHHRGRDTPSTDPERFVPSPPLENVPPGIPEKRKNKRHHRRHNHHHNRGVSSPDESADSCSENFGYPGHVTGHVTDGESDRDWSGRPPNPLSPLHEHQVMENMSSRDQRFNWRENPGNFPVATGNHHRAQHSSQPMLSRNHSPSPPPLPTSLPPPLSLHPTHACSMDHIIDHPHHQTRHEPRIPPSYSHTQFQNSGIGFQNGVSQPVLPTTGVTPRPPSPEYAEPKLVTKSHRSERLIQPQQMLAVPPKSRSRQGSKGKPLSSAPNLAPPQPPQTSVELQPVVPPKAPKSRGFGRSTSEQTTGHSLTHSFPAHQAVPPPTYPPHPQSNSLASHPQAVPPPTYPPHPQSNPPPPTVHPTPGQDLKGLLTQWKSDQERQERHKTETLLQLNGYPNGVGLLDMPEGLHNGLGSSTAPSTSSRPSINSQHDRWTATSSPQPTPLSHHQIQNAETPIVKNAPPVFSKPQSRSTGPPSRSRKKDLEDIYQRDPRKPRRRKGRVPGAVWQQMPMNNRIESSSSESDDSIDSDDAASLTSEYV